MKHDIPALVSGVIREVAELGDRTSPEDRPDMMLVTADELSAILASALSLTAGEAVAWTSQGQLNEVAKGGVGSMFRDAGDEFLTVALYTSPPAPAASDASPSGGES